MPLPDLDNGQLPPGDWAASMDEVRNRFATNFRRREVFEGLEHVVLSLAAHGVTDIWIDGSFVSDKARPNDVDVIYAITAGSTGTDWDDVGPSRRDHLKKYHRVDLWRFPSPQPAKDASGLVGKTITIKEYFETDREGNPRGLVKLQLLEEMEAQ